MWFMSFSSMLIFSLQAMRSCLHFHAEAELYRSISSSIWLIHMSIIHRKWSCIRSCDRGGSRVRDLLSPCLVSSPSSSQAILPIACWFINLFIFPTFVLALSMRLDEFSWHCFRHPSNLCAVILMEWEGGQSSYKVNQAFSQSCCFFPVNSKRDRPMKLSRWHLNCHVNGIRLSLKWRRPSLWKQTYKSGLSTLLPGRKYSMYVCSLRKTINQMTSRAWQFAK